MKRNLELIRHILLTFEEQHNGKNKIVNADFYSDDYTPEEVSYHLTLLYDDSYIKATPIRMAGTHLDCYSDHSITMEGHDYLDSVRDKKVWDATKKKIGDQLTSAPLDIVKTVASKVILTMLNI